MEFNNKLYELRTQRGFSQEELGKRLNTTSQTVSQWETGELTPDLTKLVEISKLFEVSLDELVLNKQPSTSYKDAIRIKIKNEDREYGLTVAGIIIRRLILIDVIVSIVYIILFVIPK